MNIALFFIVLVLIAIVSTVAVENINIIYAYVPGDRSTDPLYCVRFNDPYLKIIDLTCHNNQIGISYFISEGWQIRAVSNTTMYLTK
ncbi:MAG TPA: hypothetical protein VI146_06755 [Nitrososphaeraceae archaeon]